MEIANKNKTNRLPEEAKEIFKVLDAVDNQTKSCSELFEDSLLLSNQGHAATPLSPLRDHQKDIVR